MGLASWPEDEEPEDRFTPFLPFSTQNGQIKLWKLKFAGFQLGVVFIYFYNAEDFLSQFFWWVCRTGDVLFLQRFLLF